MTALKIDHSFVKHLGDNPEDIGIVRAIVMLAEALDLEMVAEGIELEHQLDELRELRCDRGLGFLFSHPIPVDQASKLRSPG